MILWIDNIHLDIPLIKSYAGHDTSMIIVDTVYVVI